MTPMENVELTDQGKESRTDGSNFTGHSACRIDYIDYTQQKLEHCLLNIFLMYNFELIWAWLTMLD